MDFLKTKIDEYKDYIADTGRVASIAEFYRDFTEEELEQLAYMYLAEHQEDIHKELLGE